MITPAKLLRTALLTVAISTVCVVSASAASVGVGTVNADALRLRDEATTDSTILATAAKGDTVVVLEDTGDGWYKVDYKSVEGYMSGEYLNVSAKADVTIGYGLVQSQGSPLNVRSGPGTSYGKVTSLNNGAVVNIVGIDNGWYKISTNGVTGYVSSDYMVTCKDSAGSRGDDTVAVQNTGIVLHDHAVFEQIYRNLLHTRQCAHTFFHTRRTSGACHPCDIIFFLPFLHCISSSLHTIPGWGIYSNSIPAPLAFAAAILKIILTSKGASFLTVICLYITVFQAIFPDII